MQWRAIGLAALLVACGSEDEPDSLGVDRSLQVTGVTDAQVAKICDWLVAQFGGYGARKECGSGISGVTPVSQAACIEGWYHRSPNPACTATVGDYEACMLAREGDLCYPTRPPACEPFTAC